MKKYLSIILALVFVLGIAGTAMAAPANPFVDVPAKHWAYDAVAKLAKAGIVDGYGDGTFRGDRTTTRYEMAQVVAKAMARSDKADAEMKALIDKLAVEFAAELNNLGVRVSKLEEKTRISWNFESRVRYGSDTNKGYVSPGVGTSGTNNFDWRQRIYLNGAVNDNVTYFARLETSSVNVKAGATGNQNIGFNRAGFNVNNFLGAFDTLTIGRFGTLGWTPGLLQARTSNNDGVSVVKKFGDTTFRAATFDVDAQSQVNFYSLNFKPADNFKMGVGYQTTNINNTTAIAWPMTTAGELKTKSWDVSAAVKFGSFNLTGEYVSTKAMEDGRTDYQGRKAYAVQLTNGVTDNFYPSFNIVDPTKAHTDAFAVSYRSIEKNAVPVTSGFGGSSNVFSSIKDNTHVASPTMAYDNDVKGYYLTYQNVVSKGVVWSLEYQSLKSKLSAADGHVYKDNVWNTSFQFFF